MRNLSTDEIVDQVEFFAGRLRRRGEHLDNVVYMGMGEPFLNYGRVMESITVLRDPAGLGLGARRITVSTVGIVPVFARFTRDAGEVNLAVSLHAPNDQLRTRLVPYNHQFPIGSIMGEVRDYVQTTRRRVSFEYVLLHGTNDSRDLAVELGALLRPLKPLVHVNLIPWNPFGGAGFSRGTREAAEDFEGWLARAGINTTIRYSKGLDIDAACGQLRQHDQLEAQAS
jgi:23S rRNA (adenine2503-C2)-methyltransferase